MVATVKEIAQKTNTSSALVSRLINNDPTLKIADDTKKKVLAAIKSMGGVKRRKASKAKTIVMVRLAQIKDVEYVVKNERTIAFTTTLEQNGYKVEEKFLEDASVFNDIVELSLSRDKCAGLLLDVGTVSPRLATFLRETNIPHICTDERLDTLWINTIYPNFVAGFRNAVNYLHKLGHKEISYIGIPNQRYGYFCASLAEKGAYVSEQSLCRLQEPEGVFPPWFSTKWRDIAKERFSQVIESGNYATAYICHNDMVALGVIDAIEENGLIPGLDISVIGSDNIEEHIFHETNSSILTTFDDKQPTIGIRSAESLLEQINQNRKMVIQEMVPMELIIRTSTGPCRNR